MYKQIVLVIYYRKSYADVCTRYNVDNEEKVISSLGVLKDSKRNRNMKCTFNLSNQPRERIPS